MTINPPMNISIFHFSSGEIKAGMAIAASKACTVMKTVSSIALTVFKYYPLYSMYESALSDVFCLKTFRHGTNPYAALSITLRGPDLTRAGKESEAAYYKSIRGKKSFWADRDQRRQAFYVAEDFNTDGSCKSSFFNYIDTKITVKHYSLLSTTTFFLSMLPLPRKWKGGLIKETVKIIKTDKHFWVLGLLCPTVKFHINPSQIQINQWESSYPNRKKFTLTRDQDGGHGALYTKNTFSVLDIGLIGVIKNGANLKIFKRINENRGQFLWGVAQLVMAVAFTAFFLPALIPGSWIVTAGVTSLLSLQKFGDLGGIVIAMVLIPPLLYAGLQI